MSPENLSPEDVSTPNPNLDPNLTGCLEERHNLAGQSCWLSKEGPVGLGQGDNLCLGSGAANFELYKNGSNCVVGATGRLCGICEEGYVLQATGACAACDSDRDSTVIWVIMAVVIFLVLVMAAACIWSSNKRRVREMLEAAEAEATVDALRRLTTVQVTVDDKTDDKDSEQSDDSGMATSLNPSSHYN